jgi:hypothetical protein
LCDRNEVWLDAEPGRIRQFDLAVFDIGDWAAEGVAQGIVVGVDFEPAAIIGGE